MKKQFIKSIILIILVVELYIAIALAIYAWRHPQLTQTQVIQNTHNAIIFANEVSR